MALRANVLAKGFSGIRRATLERADRAAQPPRAPARAEPRLGRRERRPRAARPPRARADRRRRGDGRRRRRACWPGGDALARGRARRPSTLGRRKGSRSSTARSRRPRSRRSRSPAPSGWRAPPTSPRRCRSTRCAARSIRSTRASTRRGRYAGQRPSAANILALLAGSAINKSHEHCGRVQDAYSLRCAAQVHGAARDALALRARDARRSRPTPPPTTRWCSPTTTRSCRAATSTARRSRSPPTCSAIALAPARDDQRAAVRSARQSGAQRPAGVPDAATAACSPAT